MNTSQLRKSLVHLYKIVEDGEKGYRVVASNLKNRALKILFQTHSHQRSRFKNELFEVIRNLGSENPPKDSILGMIHRGRINIFATLTIGDENIERMLFKEVLLGERVALKTYERTLREDLPPEIRTLIERQHQQVLKVVDQIRLLLGQNGKRLMLRLYDARGDAEQAVQSLKAAGISTESVKIEVFHSPVPELSKSPPTTIMETILSGAVGGQFWGVITGVLAAAAVITLSALNQEPAPLLVALVALLVLMVQGGFTGGMIGLFIGWGVTSQDRYVIETVRQGEVILRALTNESLASRAWQIMNQIAVASRARHVSESPA